MPDKIKQLQHLWNDLRLSATEIGKQWGKTRSAITGLISRGRGAGYQFDQRTTRPPSSKPAIPFKPQRLPTRSPAPPPSRRSVPQVPQAEVTIHELEPFHCKAVIGRSASRDLPTYCGKGRLEDRPYCAEHQEKYSSGPRT